MKLRFNDGEIGFGLGQEIFEIFGRRVAVVANISGLSKGVQRVSSSVLYEKELIMDARVVISITQFGILPIEHGILQCDVECGEIVAAYSSPNGRQS